MQTETIVRNFFRAWHKRDWEFVEGALAEGFSFTSLYDDHIDKHEYKRKCWDSIKEIAEFEFVLLMEKGDDVLVRYKGRINGESVQNTEHFRFQNGKIKEVTVFFGRPEGAVQSNKK